jgi:hypothetical protein
MTLKTGAGRSARTAVLVEACPLGSLGMDVFGPGADASGLGTGVGSGCPALVHVICGWPPVNR